MSGFGSTYTLPMNSTVNSTGSNGSTQCSPTFILIEISHKSEHYASIVPSLVIAILVFLVNVIIAASLIHSWKKLQQSIYVFALSIAISDCMLGLVNMGFIVKDLVANSEAHTHYYDDVKQDSSYWFQTITTAHIMATEVATAGQTFLITLSFYRYVCALVKQEDETNFRSYKVVLKKSILLSRNKSWVLTSVIWALWLILFVLGCLFNCADECICHLHSISELRSIESAICHHENGCSYVLPSLNSKFAAVAVSLFLLFLASILVMCVRTIVVLGGWGALLPYSCYLKLVRLKVAPKENQRSDDAEYSSDVSTTNFNGKPVHRKNSTQLLFTHNMTHFVFYMALGYCVFRLPANILLLADVAAPNSFISPSLITGLTLVAFAHSLVNPLILYFTLHRMKQCVTELFEMCCIRVVSERRGVPLQETSQNVSAQRSASNKSIFERNRRDTTRGNADCQVVTEL